MSDFHLYTYFKQFFEADSGNIFNEVGPQKKLFSDNEYWKNYIKEKKSVLGFDIYKYSKMDKAKIFL